MAARPGGVAQLVERLTGSQEVRGFESHRLHVVRLHVVVSREMWLIGFERGLVAVAWCRRPPLPGAYPSRIAVIRTVSKFMTNEPP